MTVDVSPRPPRLSADDPKSRIKSYVVRAGRLTAGQARALEVLAPHFVLDYNPNAPFFAAKEAEQTPAIPGFSFKNIVLEIGTGMGEATAAIAQAMPETGFIGCEVHPPGVGALLQRIEAMNLQNLRIAHHDAFEVLRDQIPDGSLHGVHLFFPDPWHKARHNKRRIVQPEFIERVAAKLKPGGYFHAATDWQPYAEHMLEVLKASSLKNASNREDGYSDKPWYRPLTKFENRGLKLGHGVWDLLFHKA
jgi:tRNA (guanine-N7-)-methyltransferase